MKDCFTPARCRLCFDKMNVFADVTVGDPHGIEGVDRERGESILIVRNQDGLRLVEAATKAASVNLREIGYQEVLTGQEITKKRTDWRGHCEAWRSLKRETPDFYEVVKRCVP